MAEQFGLLNRSDFPSDFMFGVGSAAFQYEGAADVDGRGPSIWDTFLHENHPEIIEAGGLNAIDHYNRYKEDVKIMKEMGWDSYRFSISWSRVLPEGRRTKGPKGEELGVNQLGVDFYNNLINELLANGIEPIITLYHWDLPQALEDEYLGFLSEKVVEDFVDYADLCFREFGDRVKTWTTLNEPYASSVGGYQLGTKAPGRGETNPEIRNSMKGILPATDATSTYEIEHNPVPKVGDSTRELYIVAHNQILCHGATVKLYRQKYQAIQKGKIGITLVLMWAIPFSDTPEDIAATKRSIEFMLGWYLDPVVFGKYPDSMTSILGSRLPKFTPEQSKELKGSCDFLGLNYYTTRYAKNNPPISRWYNPDSQAITLTENKDGVPIGPQAGSDWLYIYPQGMLDYLVYVKENYGDPIIYVTENGVDELTDDSKSLWESLYDTHRISYFYLHLLKVKEAIEKGVKVKGYYAWSLHDNLEWGEGFHSRFGINYINFAGNLERIPKLASGWFKFLLAK